MQENLLQEAKAHFNEPILICFEVCRCIGYAEDDEDCYLVARHPGGKVIWHTFVGGYTYLDVLKGQNHRKSSTGEQWDDFTILDDLLSLNGAPKESEFVLSILAYH